MSDSLADLDKAFEAMMERFPEKRMELVKNCGEKMHKKVLRNIDVDTNEETGRLRDACYLAIGSEGGYAAVRNDHRKAPHAHLVEFGHKLVKGAKTKEGKFGQTVKVKGSGRVIGWVNGKHMYRNAMNEMESELIQDAERMIDSLVGELF